jgi:hypothetical protein
LPREQAPFGEPVLHGEHVLYGRYCLLPHAWHDPGVGVQRYRYGGDALLAQDLAHRVCGLTTHARQHVAVGVQGDGDGGVA